jgi:hypothetical protein
MKSTYLRNFEKPPNRGQHYKTFGQLLLDSTVGIVSDFVQLGFNLSNGVTDTLESSTILIYSEEHMSLNTQSLGRTPK